MASFTRRELIDQVATKLGVLAAGQTLSVEDLNALQTQCDCLFDQLSEDDILTIGDEEEIPASWCPFLALLVANLAGPDYGAPFSDEVKTRNEQILRRLVRAHQTYEPQTPDYY